MAALITAGALGATGNVAASGSVKLIASGDFSGGAEIEVTIEADSLPAAKIHLFNNPGSVTVDAVTGQTVTTTVVKANANTSVNISAL